MIEHLKLQNIGPVRKLELEFGSRLNLITGDNGLGKTFLLDSCWYALTRTWADNKAIYPPVDAPSKPLPVIRYKVIGKTGKASENRARYSFSDQSWSRLAARPPMPGLVVYARIDGGFSVWDPARNYWNDGGNSERPPSYQFSKTQVWDGLEEGEEERRKVICNGLLRDIESWRAKANGTFGLLEAVLRKLSPSCDEALRIGEGVRVRLSDVRDIPTLVMPYGAIPVTQAAAGMRRVLALAYLLVWAWEEHRMAANLRRESPCERIVLLFDEVEAHLHPKWQRVFLPALMEVIKSFARSGASKKIVDQMLCDSGQRAQPPVEKAKPSVQVIATTHAPLVMSSVEQGWNDEINKLFEFELNSDREVQLVERPFIRHGSAANWLTSDSFDLPTGYPLAAEQAMQAADAFMRNFPIASDAPRDEKEQIHKKLLSALGGDDEYWPYWLPYFEQRKGRR